MTIFGLNSYLFAKNTPDDLAIIVLTYFPVGLIVWFLFQFLAGRNKGKVKASASFLVLFCALILSGQVGYTNMQQEYEQATSKTSSFSALKLSDKASALYDNSKFAEIISLAEQGDPVAELFLARMYDKGKGVSKNQESASSGYKKTYADLLIRAENGDAVAQFFLGRMLKLDADFDFKIDSISTVINKSTAEVKTNNSTLSSSVPQNDEHAIFWLTKSAEQNYTNAQNELGNIYRYAKGVSKNYPQAVFWYTKAAENGLIEAQSKLAQLYSQENENSRDGFPPDYQKAFYWYKKASEQGDADSLNALGHMSAAGKGVPKNVQQAIYWYTKAAELGKTDAQYQIGMLFYGGLGVPQNYILANMWFTIASANGNDMAFNSKESVSKNMSSDQIQHAQILADKWMINHPKQPLKP
jgi:TPR repeat protein